jgi:hypothetical protein
MKFIITESQYKILLENIPVIDDILDKMSKVGYENLTSQEKSTLNKYSEHLKNREKLGKRSWPMKVFFHFNLTTMKRIWELKCCLEL